MSNLFDVPRNTKPRHLWPDPTSETHPNAYTAADLAQLRRNYPDRTMPVAEVAARLGRSVYSVQQKARRLCLTRPRRPPGRAKRARYLVPLARAALRPTTELRAALALAVCERRFG